MQDRLYRSDLVGCVTVASNAWPVMAMTPRPPPPALQFVISDPATVTGDRLMIVPPGCLGQIGWAAARFCCNWATSQYWWWWGQMYLVCHKTFLHQICVFSFRDYSFNLNVLQGAEGVFESLNGLSHALENHYFWKSILWAELNSVVLIIFSIDQQLSCQTVARLAVDVKSANCSFHFENRVGMICVRFISLHSHSNIIHWRQRMWRKQWRQHIIPVAQREQQNVHQTHRTKQRTLGVRTSTMPLTSLLSFL